MPRPPRTSLAGECYHVLNRGNSRATVFHKEDDYAAFVRLLADACHRRPMSVLAFCLMPNHFHLVVQPRADGDLSHWMQWLTTAHVRRYHRHYHGSGHVWQDRYKSFPVQPGDHLYIVLRYVERNPLRANLVERAQNWQWSSLRWWRRSDRPSFLVEGPFEHPVDWVRRVNRPETDAELAALRNSMRRGAPLGDETWQLKTAKQHHLQSTLRPQGRPSKAKK